MAGTLDISKLSKETVENLKELDDDLEEGYITQKGYDKKRKILLDQYRDLSFEAIGSDSPRSQSPSELIIEDIEAIGEEFSISSRKDAVHAVMQDQRTSGPISSKRSVPINRYVLFLD